MIVKEIIQINSQNYNHTYSDDGHVLRCGRLKYFDAVDPIDVEKAYFEEGVIPAEPETNEEVTENGISDEN